MRSGFLAVCLEVLKASFKKISLLTIKLYRQYTCDSVIVYVGCLDFLGSFSKDFGDDEGIIQSVIVPLPAISLWVAPKSRLVQWSTYHVYLVYRDRACASGHHCHHMQILSCAQFPTQNASARAFSTLQHGCFLC